MANSGGSYYSSTRHVPRCVVRDTESRMVLTEAQSTSEALELDESDAITQVAAGSTSGNGTTRMWSRSTPVNIPDWSKIIGKQQLQEEASNEEYVDCRYNENDGFTRTPPHEFVAKRMASVTSFSVQEGVGRTLKGRDLSTLRNTIWEKTGFMDGC